MAIDQEEIGQRFKGSREACSMTQDDVAGHLGVSRSTATQMDLGNPAVTGLQIRNAEAHPCDTSS